MSSKYSTPRMEIKALSIGMQIETEKRERFKLTPSTAIYYIECLESFKKIKIKKVKNDRA